jgi:hypothetical protein
MNTNDRTAAPNPVAHSAAAVSERPAWQRRGLGYKIPIALMLFGWTLLAMAEAQSTTPAAAPSSSSGWNAVRNLPLGTAISVKGKGWRRDHCKYVSADDEWRECRAETLPGPNLFPPPVLHFLRGDIREVRLEHPAATGAIAALVVGGGILALTSNGRSGTSDPIGGALTGVFFGAIAGGIGHTFPVHGRVIYRP